MRHCITQMFPIRGYNDYSKRWQYMREKYNLIFPKDYRLFIDTYGSGSFNNFLWVMSPFSLNDNLNLLKKFNDLKRSFCTMKSILPDMLMEEFYDGVKGLLPWGITDNGDELYWNVQKEYSQIVVFSCRYSEKLEFDLTFGDFLDQIFSQKIMCSIFPEDFILNENYYDSLE